MCKTRSIDRPSPALVRLPLDPKKPVTNPRSSGTGCIAALEAEKYLAESESLEAQADKPVATDRSIVQPAVQEVNGEVKKDPKGAVGEYKSNPLL